MKDGWEIKQIGEVCAVIAGQSPKGSAYNDQGVGLPFYQGKKEFRERHIGPPTKWTSVVTKEGEPGDILMSVRAPVGPINEATQKICIGRGLAAIRARGELDRDFLWYALLWLQPKIKGTAGAVFDSINKAGIESLTIPIPPLEEQQRIVLALDEAFEGLARAHAHAKANFQNTRELFRNTLAIRTNADEFSKVPLNEICDVRDGTHDTPKYVEDGVPLVTQKNIRPEGLSLDNVKLISQADHLAIHKRSNVAQGDILISMIGVNRGMSCIVDSDDVFSIKNVGLIKSTPNVNMDFLLLYLQSSDAEKYVEEATNGGAQPFVGLGKLRAFPTPVPDRALQDEIASELMEMREAVALLAKYYEIKLQDLDDLRQSFLQKAFAGELK